MAKIKFIVEIDFESWFDEEKEPKTKEDWENFLLSHFMPESSILGVDDGETQDMIAINSCSIDIMGFNDKNNKTW